MDSPTHTAWPMDLLPWSPALKIIAGSFHGVAIACTVFRLIFRWYMSRFWWEDGWATFALTVDMVCFASALLDPFETVQEPAALDGTTEWMVAIAFPCVLWACRISILFSIVRVANPSQQLRRIAFLVGCSFIVMWASLIGQKIDICMKNNCKIAGSVGLSQLITDVISDSALVGLPVYFLRSTRVTRGQRILIYSVFSASLLITAVTILHSIALFRVKSTGIIVIGHVKTALSLIVCNLLVIVAFIYRVCRRGKGGDLDVPEEVISFTSVDLNTGFTDSGVGKHTTTGVVQISTMSERPRSTEISAGVLGVEEKDEGATGSDS